MRLNEITFTEAKPVEGYGPGFFRIGGEVIEGGVLTGPAGTGPWGGYEDAEALLALADRVDVLFLGTGSEITPLPKTLQSKLEKAGVPFELMSTPSAARTYNVLLSEGRRVGAALMPIT